MARHRAVVVEPEERDHVANIGFVADRAGRRPLRIGEHRVRDDSTLLAQLRPDLLGKPEVGGAIAVQVADFPAPNLERQLTEIARRRVDPRPGRHFCADSIAVSFFNRLP